MAAIKYSLILLALLSLALQVHSTGSGRHQQDQDWRPGQSRGFDECLTTCQGQASYDPFRYAMCYAQCYNQGRQQSPRERRWEDPESLTSNDRSQPGLSEEVSECLSQCVTRDVRRFTQCRQQCFDKYQQSTPPRSINRGRGWEDRESQDEQDREQGNQNPFYFSSDNFKTRFQSQEGEIRVLQRFTKKSNLLQVLDDVRVKLLRINPQTVLLPHHIDAEKFVFVFRGEAILNYLWPQNQLQSFRLRAGQLIRVPAGAFVYLINHNNNQELRTLEFVIPNNIRGKYREFFPVGAESRQSYLRHFNKEILEAAFNAPWNELQQVLEPQNKEVFVKVSREQIQELVQESQRQSRSETQRHGSESQSQELFEPIDVFNGQELASNEYGRHIQATPESHKQLRDYDISLGLINITRGGMTLPYYNSRSTKGVFVEKGEGKVTIITPYLNQQQQGGRQERGGRQESGVQYQRVESNIKQGDFFVVPEAHPFVIVASPRSTLQLVTFGVRAAFNRKFFEAGAENIFNQMHPALLDLTLGGSAKQAKEVLRRQEKEQFAAGPDSEQAGRPRMVTE